ncbi:HpcH/HpaI aldolase/citrate lyase family protein [Tsukamurella sp. 8F]|uniref:HpcH/HpaI aldolase/citrate lyase family protein n=1 Tax=unclassified Tsukamurella TaxID=2633480 RepID=UPI0023B9EFA8|nr:MULTISPECIES: HpcH/HpaI aldolase/citrate lyase family protein [unclassified Tsukamurella]MDF0530443.1 HpcH/HpaI aldolase/citrate lyase family protein [Tsukamurella sp. 8J]MDF0587736.1 HpcH/HpaI aldolase/citrate lyase family protein [Tsukamurella sp. 8F]
MPAPSALRHFHRLPQSDVDALFLCAPQPFTDDAPRDLLAHALGATLYVPATRPGLAELVARRYADGVASMVVDLEDAVADDDVEKATLQAISALRELAGTPAAAMLLFVRPRSAGAITRITEALGPEVEALTGFVLPKFAAADGTSSLAAVADASERAGKWLYAMPVLEGPELVYRESRDAELDGIAALLAAHRERILAVRVGATDMCSLFGIRRDRDLTVYDVRVVADAIAAIVNRFGRSDGTGFVVTGPVWEYFDSDARSHAKAFGARPGGPFPVSPDIGGLLREVALDRANGLYGKTVIHPSHVPVVHALAAVSHEEYQDALDIGRAGSGITPSAYRNKMNEVKPHRLWAEQTLLRASAFGVIRAGVTHADLLRALAER